MYILHESYEKQISNKTRYLIAINFMEMTKNIQQQYSRFIIYNLSCKIIMNISKQFM
jgi:hypothetical protein